MARQIGKHRPPLFNTALGIALAEHALRAGLMHASHERKLAAMVGGVGRNEAPAGQHLGETDDVVLAIAAAHTERMQFQNLARQIFVETLGAVDAGD